MTDTEFHIALQQLVYRAERALALISRPAGQIGQNTKNDYDFTYRHLKAIQYHIGLFEQLKKEISNQTQFNVIMLVIKKYQDLENQVKKQAELLKSLVEMGYANQEAFINIMRFNEHVS